MSTPRPNPLFRDRQNSQLLISLISQIWGPSPPPTLQLSRWNEPSGHMSFSHTADSRSKCRTRCPTECIASAVSVSGGVSQSAVCASHGCVYRLDLTSMGKRSPLGQICGRLVPFSLTTTLGRHTHTHTLTGACPITDLIAAMTATGLAF